MVGAVLGVIQAGVGIAGLISSSKDKNKGTPEESPELRSAYQRAVEQSEYGYNAQQKASFDQKLAGEGQMAYRRGVDVGGGSLSAAVSSGINAMQLGARNDFAMNDASLQMQKQQSVYSLAGQIQGQSNLKANYNQQQYNAEQQAYGGALKAGTESFGNAIKQNQYMGFMKDMYGQDGGANAPDTSAPVGTTVGMGAGGLDQSFAPQDPSIPTGTSFGYNSSGQWQSQAPQQFNVPQAPTLSNPYTGVSNPFSFGNYGQLTNAADFDWNTMGFPAFATPKKY